MPTETLTEAIEHFLTIAGVDPLSLALLLVGNLLLAVSIGLFGYLTLGGLVSGLRPT